MASKTLTAPLALIKVNGITAGRARNLTITETFQRGTVKGIGRITPAELPVIDWTGTVTSEHYEINFATSGLPQAINRVAPSVQGFVDNILLDCEGIDIVILKKVCDFTDPETGLIIPKFQEHLTIKGGLIDREGINITENQVSGHNQDFQYLYPIIIKPEDLVAIEGE